MCKSNVTDRYEEFVSLFARHERAVRGVVRSMLPLAQDADDVMQEVGLACWHKFADFQQNDSQDAFLKWACVIARFETLKHRRKLARDRLVLSEQTIRILSAEIEQHAASREMERTALEECLQRLQTADRRLLLCVHTRGDSIAEIARQLGENVRRLYSRVNVLRDKLGECVRNKLVELGA